MCFAPLNVQSIVSAWQDPEIQDGRETGFVFSLMEILHLVFFYHYVGLWRGLVNNPILFHSFFIFSVHKEQNVHFPSAQENARKGKCTKPQCGEAASPPLQSLLTADKAG